MTQSPEDEAFGEAVYRAWKRGMNPDRVTRERIIDTLPDYVDPADCAQAEVDRLARIDRERYEAQAREGLDCTLGRRNT